MRRFSFWVREGKREKRQKAGEQGKEGKWVTTVFYSLRRVYHIL